MKKYKKEVIFLISLIFIIFMISGCFNANEVETQEEGIKFDATAGDLNKDAIIVAIGASVFTPPTHLIMVSGVSTLANSALTNALSSTQPKGVPWMSQVPPYTWSTTGNCGPVSYLMAEAFYYNYNLGSGDSYSTGLITNLDHFIVNSNIVGKGAPEDFFGRTDEPGISISQLQTLARQRGNFALATKPPSLDALETALNEGHPIIVRVIYQPTTNTTDDMELIPGKNIELTNPEKGKKYDLGHYMLLVGMDSKYVYLNDPGMGWNLEYPTPNHNYGYQRRYSIPSFEKVWAHISPSGAGGNEAVVFYPNGAIPPLAIDLNSLNLSQGEINESYYATLTALNGVPPYNWSAIGGSLPNGITVTTDGIVRGFPTQAGIFTCTVRVTDTYQQKFADAQFSITISPNALTLSAPEITTAKNLPIGNVKTPYNVTLSATGGQGPYQWSVISGNLPYGLALSGNGEISGTPITNGIYSFTVQLTDSSSPSQETSKEFSVTILSQNSNPIISSLTANPSSVNIGNTSTITCNAFDPDNDPITYSWQATGGNLSGQGSNVTWTAPATAGVYVVTCSASDSNGGSVEQGIGINVGSGGGSIQTNPTLTVSPTSGQQGTTFYYTGNGYTPNGKVKWHVRKPDGTEYTPSDLIGNINGSGSFSYSYTSSCNSMVGNYTIWAIDMSTGISSNSVTETISNSSSCAQSDLIIQNLSVTPTSGNAGSNATVSFTIYNQGGGTANANTTNVRINQSSSGVTTSDPLLVSLSIPSIPAGGSYNVNQNVTIPSGQPAGTNYVWVILDVYNQANQSNINNDKGYVVFTVTSSGTQVERIVNGSFSSGSSGWTLVGDFWAGTNFSNYRTPPGYAAGGVDSTGVAKNGANGQMYQNVNIPSNATSATLSFWYNITSQETGSTAYDVLNVTIADSSGNYLATVAVLSNVNQNTGYQQVTFNATPYKGQTIRINFLATTDSTNTTVFRIDDVSLMSDGN